MITLIFTVDYEIYGDGSGSLTDHVILPGQRLMDLFLATGNRMVFFVEAAEFETIERFKISSEVNEVRKQVKELYHKGFEIGLHLHPQWYNARYQQHGWELDYQYYNLCHHPKGIIRDYVTRGISYLKKLVDDASFVPVSYRAGNWLFQPTKDMAEVLHEQGVLIDSSVFKGGLQHSLGLDYRPAVSNGFYWLFHNDINVPDSNGILWEIPIYTKLVPSWKMLKTKRLYIHGRKQGAKSTRKKATKRFLRLMDFVRLRYPLKLDFCRMTETEMIDFVKEIVAEDKKTPNLFKPMVAIGHTKDLVDIDGVTNFLEFLKRENIQISTFQSIVGRLG